MRFFWLRSVPVLLFSVVPLTRQCALGGQAAVLVIHGGGMNRLIAVAADQTLAVEQLVSSDREVAVAQHPTVVLVVEGAGVELHAALPAHGAALVEQGLRDGGLQ